MSRSFPRSRRPGLLCPNCQVAPLRFGGGSHSLSPLVRVAYAGCTDVQCGFTCRVETVITHEISPAAVPRVGLNLPRLKRAAANDDGPARPAVEPV